MLNARQPEEGNAFDQETNLRAVKTLERFARRFKQSCDRRALREIMRLLVAASGHDVHEVRNRANVALERVFAPKPFDAPVATSFLNVRKGDVHCFHFALPPQDGRYFVRVYTAPAEQLPVEDDLRFMDIDLRYDAKEGACVAQFQFRELGHYDYLVYQKMRKGERWLNRPGCSGRINVSPDVRGEIVLEIFPDIHGHTRLYWHDAAHPGLVYNENGQIIRIGRFSDIAAHLEDLQRRYHVTALYLLGAQKRGTNHEDWTPEANSPSPFAPLSLTEMEPALGGDEELRSLIDRAHALGIKVILDLIPHLNRKSREVPEEFAVQCFDEAGNLVARASTDGQYGSWNDGKLLNYRKLEVWEWLTGGIARLIEAYDIDGVRFDSCHAMPIMMKKNNEITVQGHERSDEQMVEGTIIVNDREDEHFITTGYYECSCREEIGSPFHYYFMRAIELTLRKKGKDFFITLAECYWGRERYLSRAGIIPYNAALFKICEDIIHGTCDVRQLYHLYDHYFPSVLSPGTELLGILGNHDERRPLNTFGLHGLRAAATLTSFMSDIVMDYEGSAEGESWKVYPDNIHVDWNRFDYASHRSLDTFYRELYERHQMTRGTGYLIWANNPRVVAAMKFTETEAWIGAFNFSESTETISLQFDRPDLPIDDNAFYRVIDTIYSPLTGHTAWYTGRELRRSRLHTVVSYTDRVKLFRVEKRQQPGVFYGDFLRDSIVRLCSIGDQAELNDNFAFREIASHLHSLEDFASFLSDYLLPLSEQIDSHLVELGVNRALYYAFQNGRQAAEKLHGYLEVLPSCEEMGVQRLGEALRAHMQRGPWVFISAEAEPFSKAGGIGDVVGHLPRELASLGEDVYVITPLYRYGDPRAVSKMQEALDEHRVAYTGTNVKFKIQDDEYEVGVHRGTVNGVAYFLLDHHEFFDGLYWGYTAEEKLRRRIAFTRACAELIVVFGLKPMVTFTNDAYAGIFNGIIRTDSVYFRNPNFQRTSFFHIIHNGGWQYFDRYDRYEHGFDHFRLFNLPDIHAGAFSDPTFGERINCMAAGVRFADRVITVSPKYAAEIALSGDGLERVLQGIAGINNGIRRDFSSNMLRRFRHSRFVETWYPRFIERLRDDARLQRKAESRYPELLDTAYACESIADPTRRGLVTRMRNKLLLQLERGLIVDPDRVLFTMIHRLVEQKGFQLLLEASEQVFGQLGCEAIAGGPLAPFDGRGEELARGLESLKERYPEQVSVSIGLQDICIPLLASDVFLMPSLYEPGGIAQLEALACGCLVVARATGGLQDTVIPIAVNGGRIRGNGFLFTDVTANALYEAMRRCTQFFDETQEELIQQVRRKGQRSIRYWDRTAREYVHEIYSTKEIVPYDIRHTESDAARTNPTKNAPQQELCVELNIHSGNIVTQKAHQRGPQERILTQVRQAFPDSKPIEREQFNTSHTSRPGAARPREV